MLFDILLLVMWYLIIRGIYRAIKNRWFSTPRPSEHVE
jgi:hypothetical protein